MSKPAWVLALPSFPMRRSFMVITALVLATAGCGSAKSRLPKCPGSYNAATWTNCFGEQTHSDGSKYVGEFKDGVANGQGTTKRPDGGTYVGEFKDDRANGQGTATRPTGEKYVGEFQDGMPHGNGSSTAPEGKYVGEFRRGVPHGQGTEYNADGSLLRTGVWEDGEFKR